jgi:hypothetical protein
MPISIVSRGAWGARAPKGDPVKVDWPRGVTLHVHHTAGSPNQTLRDIQLFHMTPEPRGRGWNDIGYNYLINEDGVIFEGRGYEVHGAHSKPVNDEPGVALIGNYSTKAPTDAQHRSVWALKAHLGAGRLAGHRDSWSTSCPGDAAYAKIVKGPPPARPRRYYFERIVDGKTKLTWGPYTRKIRRDAYYLLIRAAHPTWGLRRYSKEA